MADFWTLVERHDEKIRRELTQSGAIVAATYNVNRAKGARALTPEDIFPFIKKRPEIPREATVTELDLMFHGIKRNFEKQKKAS